MLTNFLYGAAYSDSDSSKFEMVMRLGGVPGDSGETECGYMGDECGETRRGEAAGEMIGLSGESRRVELAGSASLLNVTVKSLVTLSYCEIVSQ
jgi:hypothetical protein